MRKKRAHNANKIDRNNLRFQSTKDIKKPLGERGSD